MRFSFLFPGQGSQSVGMGKDLYDSFDCARMRFNQANEILGRDLMSIIFDGPMETLTSTENTQPALFLIEAVIADILAESSVVPIVTAGHSLGEYGALYGSGVLSFEDGLRAVARRGALMAEAGKANPGTMAAIIGLGKDALKAALLQVSCGVVVAANENTPDQTVISGEVAAVQDACEKCKAAGAKRALPLPVSGAFHSPLMQTVANSFKTFLDTITFKIPRCPVISNVTATGETDPLKIKDLLLKQLVSPVRWVDSIATLASLEYGVCIETGPKDVLKGLVKKCNDSINVVSCGSAANIFSLKSENNLQ